MTCSVGVALADAGVLVVIVEPSLVAANARKNSERLATDVTNLFC